MNPLSGASLRPGTEEDIPGILQIEKQSHPEPWSDSHFRQELSVPYSRILVLTDDETDSIILGYLVYWLQAEAVSLLNVTVAPACRGLGFSRILIGAMVNEAVREEIPKVILEVRESNETAIRVYERMGFKKTHERKGFYSNGETAFVMELKTSDLSPWLN